MKVEAYLAGMVTLVPRISTLKYKAVESIFSRAPIGKRIFDIVDGEAFTLSAVILIRFFDKLPCNFERL
jgi:hypothetical protein